MGISDRHRLDAADSPNLASVDSLALLDLVTARAALDRARSKAKWIRKSKELHRATRAVEVAALAAHSAGVGWNEIGDALGIERAMTPHAPSRADIERAAEHRHRGELPDYGAAVAL